jgi:hypothetical protein
MRQHHFKDSGIDVLPLGDPVDSEMKDVGGAARCGV